MIPTAIETQNQSEATIPETSSSQGREPYQLQGSQKTLLVSSYYPDVPASPTAASQLIPDQAMTRKRGAPQGRGWQVRRILSHMATQRKRSARAELHFPWQVGQVCIQLLT